MRITVIALQNSFTYDDTMIVLAKLAGGYRAALDHFFPNAEPSALDSAAAEFERLMRKDFEILSSHADDGSRSMH